MKKFKVNLKRNKFNIFLLIICIFIAFFIFVKPEAFKINLKKDFHKDIITLSSVFGGFSFTTYGIIIGLSSQRVMRKLERMGFTSAYYFSVSCSLVAIVVSLICSLIGLFISRYNESIFIAQIELISFIIGVLFFIASIINVLMMQKIIRNEIRETKD